MGKWEEQVMQESMSKIRKRPRMFRRFVNDIFGPWKGMVEDFMKFVEICNNIEPRIKVTWENSKNEAIFLDARIVVEDDGSMRTELYVKPTDRTCYLHKESDHPQHVKQGIAKGQVKRLRRLNTSDEDYEK